MAERAQQSVPETPDAPGEKVAQDTQGNRSSGSWLSRLLIVALTLGPAAAGAWLAYFYYPSLAQAAEQFSGTKDDKEEKKPSVEYGQFMELQGFIVNPAGTDGTRYLMINLGLESAKGDVLEELKEKEIVVRDTVLKLLGQRTVEELADISLRAQLKKELREAVNGILQKGKIDRVYFTQYVLQ
ncbi:flagellar basal body-associated protein FliL [Rhodothermus marinus SG0.5JP17-172]|uniref:flagellar basal body-associated FliL family protein n=1 Tax=Rhodothermus marinus TaxID=29549 RepID=UPI000223D90B|nr:flagellar basal body-associated FliL family protein [Rhodothermus marinus]AEN74015.1 flagellar basal body-associated protein FliL [Rhodothermus marinus SG0.5JP17-172]